MAHRREVGASELQSKRRELPVKPGQPPGVVTEHVPGAQVEHALGAAYSYLNKRERTTLEVDRRLRREGFSPETIARALAILHDQGALDDQRFARLFAEDKRALERWGGERIRRALIHRGVDSDTVATVIDGSGGEPDSSAQSERDRAVAVLCSRFPEPPRTRRDRDRALGMLLRKGYEPELAFEALCAYSRD